MARPAPTLWLFVAALVLAPALASLWPAFGKGPMLYTGAPPALAAPHHDAASGDHAGHAEHGLASDASVEPAHDHAQHCALCVLVSLAWAPVVHIAGGADTPPAVRRHAAGNGARPPLLVVWSRPLARAPPSFS